ncbi:MAG: protein kinase, partial [Lacipirellulaceae bacterium]
TPKLADFNVSYNGGHAEEDPKDAFGGSLAYMSPEQLEACHPLLGGSPQLVRESADIFAFGVMMWEMLTGKRPFRDELAGSQGGQLARLQRMIEMRLNTDFQELSRVLPDDCPPPLRRTLERCLNPDKKERYRTAGQLAQALRVCLNPRAWKLLEPPTSAIGKFALGWPVMSMMLAGLIPNIFIAVFNYLYNRLRMSGDWPELYQRFDHVQLIINSVAFPLGIGIMVWAGLRVSRQLKEPPLREKAVHRVLLFGNFVAMVLLFLWSASGAAFPLAIAWGSPLKEGWGFHLHFFTSLAICGLGAIVYPYFIITALATRYGVPALVRNEIVEGPAQSDLERLKKLNRVYLALAGLVPLLALLLLALTGTQQSWALIVASGVGLVGLAAMFWLESQIGLDLEALETITVD